MEKFKCGHDKSDANVRLIWNGTVNVQRCLTCLKSVAKGNINKGGKKKVCEHGVLGKTSCAECKRASNLARNRKHRRNKGIKERPLGCSSHGYYPAAECTWCHRDKREKQRRARGAKKRVYGMCSKHKVRTWDSPCKECHRERSAKYRQKMRARLAEQNKFEAKLEDALAQSKVDKALASLEKKLRPRPEAQQAWDTFQEAMEAERTACFERPDEFMDYQDDRYPTDDPDNVGRKRAPTAAEAAALCEGCPFLGNLCADYAEVAKEPWGVWNGKRYKDGRVVK